MQLAIAILELSSPPPKPYTINQLNAFNLTQAAELVTKRIMVSIDAWPRTSK